ncbi:MAG TPA: ribonuclease E inhibitor RraB [Terriglobales bacterium]|nr:ribonuclease E inhibitor RraB [Terriglobales bacterium]
MDWLGMFVPRINFRKPSLESLNEPDEADLERLAELRDQGSRLNLPHPVRGFLVFEAEEPARQAAEQLRKEGFRCAVRAGQDGTWTATAVTQVVPTPGAIQKLREQFEKVGSAHQGSYRGWDAPVVY